MEKDFKKYDEICASALSWILWNNQKHPENLCFTNLNSSDSDDLWLLSIANFAGALIEKKIYVSLNIIDFLYLKYIKKYKSLKFAWSLKNKYIIDGVIFKDELLESCGETLNILSEIYNEYYRR